MSSIDETWATPKWLFNQLNEEFLFKLDAAALQKSALCEQWYGPDHPDPERRDALTIDWNADTSGAIWLNPPYGRKIGNWMKKANDVAKNGATVVCLVPARTDTAWWHSYCIQHEIRFIKGRLKFSESKNAAPFPSAIVIVR